MVGSASASRESTKQEARSASATAASASRSRRRRRCSRPSSPAAVDGKERVCRTLTPAPSAATSVRRASSSTSSLVASRGDHASVRASTASSTRPMRPSSRATLSSARRRLGRSPFAAAARAASSTTASGVRAVSSLSASVPRRLPQSFQAIPAAPAASSTASDQQDDRGRTGPGPVGDRCERRLLGAPADVDDGALADAAVDDERPPLDRLDARAGPAVAAIAIAETAGGERDDAASAQRLAAGVEAAQVVGVGDPRHAPGVDALDLAAAGHFVGLEQRLHANSRRVDDRGVESDVDGGDDRLTEGMPVGRDLRSHDDRILCARRRERGRVAPAADRDADGDTDDRHGCGERSEGRQTAHQARLQADCRSVDQAANDSNTSSSSAEPISTGSIPSPSRSLRSCCPPLLVRPPPRGRLAGAQPHEPRAPGCRGQRHDDAVDLRKALLPDGILDHDRDDVPAAVERVLPRFDRRRREEVGKDEDEAGRGNGAPVESEEVERTGDVGGRLHAVGPRQVVLLEDGIRSYSPVAPKRRFHGRRRTRGSRSGRGPRARWRRRSRSRSARPRPCPAREAPRPAWSSPDFGRRRRRRAAPRRRSAPGR